MIFEGFLLGLSTGTYCTLTCTPLLLPLLCTKKHSPGETGRLLGMFLGGRFAAYLLVGALLGLAGTFTLGYVEPRLQNLLGAIAYLLAGGAMILQGLHLGGHKGRACRASGRIKATGNAAVFGFASGFAICPPFVGAAARVFGGGSTMAAGAAGAGLLQGMGYFGLFFLGTALFFLPLLGLGFLRKIPVQLPLVARMVMIMLGIYFVVALGILRLAGAA